MTANIMPIFYFMRLLFNVIRRRQLSAFGSAILLAVFQRTFLILMLVQTEAKALLSSAVKISKSVFQIFYGCFFGNSTIARQNHIKSALRFTQITTKHIGKMESPPGRIPNWFYHISHKIN